MRISHQHRASVIVLMVFITAFITGTTAGFTAADQSEAARAPDLARIDNRSTADLREFGASPYNDGKERADLLQSRSFHEDHVLVSEHEGHEVYHPVDSAWFITDMLNSFEATGNHLYLDYAKANMAALVKGSELTETGRWFPYQFDYKKDQITLSAPWISGMPQGMLLSCASRLYELTGDAQYEKYAQEILATYSAPKTAGAYWFANREDCPWGSPCLYLEEYPSLVEDENAHVVNGFIYSAWGLYDCFRVFDDSDAMSLFLESIQTLEYSFPRYRAQGKSSFYAMTDFGYELWGRPTDYHVGVIHQLEVTASIVHSPALQQQADILRADCAAESCEDDVDAGR